MQNRHFQITDRVCYFENFVRQSFAHEAPRVDEGPAVKERKSLPAWTDWTAVIFLADEIQIFWILWVSSGRWKSRHVVRLSSTNHCQCSQCEHNLVGTSMSRCFVCTQVGCSRNAAWKPCLLVSQIRMPQTIKHAYWLDHICCPCLHPSIHSLAPNSLTQCVCFGKSFRCFVCFALFCVVTD